MCVAYTNCLYGGVDSVESDVLVRAGWLLTNPYVAVYNFHYDRSKLIRERPYKLMSECESLDLKFDTVFRLDNNPLLF